MRTTVDIDDPILKEVKALGKKEGKALGRVVSDLLAGGLRARRSKTQAPRQRRWISRPMASLVNLADKDALYAAMERSEVSSGASRR